MLHPDDIRADFQRLIGQPENSLDLARAALLIAAEAAPEIDVDREMHTLERWAGELRTRIDPQWNNLQKLARLRAYVFDDLGFRGDERDYYSPSNSLLHEVMKRRRGIPLTLSILFLELGWRIGMPLEGVGFPGHFLVRLSGEPGDLLLDPYSHACSVHEEDCRRMLLEVTGGKLEYDRKLTASVTKRAMLVRLLQNLKGAYLRAGDDGGALAAVERLLLLRPGDVEETRDRGLLLFRLHRYGPALESLERYLAERTHAEDRERIREHVTALRQIVADLN
jgi:regulator of sirC expression with transglutaminase-like and TPR domain